MAPRLALCSPLAESSSTVRLLRQHGYTVKVAGAASADIVLPQPGGSLAFILLDASSSAAAAPAIQKAAHAAKAARRCTLLAVGGDAQICQTVAGPPGVSMLWCEDHAQACEFMLSCAQRVSSASEPSAASAAEELNRAQHVATERVSTLLAQLWGLDDTHAVDFLLAARPLGSLARVTSEADWEHVCAETQGLVDRDLLYTAIEWLQSDAVLHTL